MIFFKGDQEVHGGMETGQEQTAATRVSDDTPIQLTEAAIAKAKRALTQEGHPDWGLRIGVVGGGCSGFQYTMNLDEAARADDVVFRADGLAVFIDPMSLPYLQGMTIDYVTGLHGAGFKFLNPNAARTCGCGSSFAV